MQCSAWTGTDEGDLNFDYLSNFGPRFRKLADMYGEDPSDEEDDNFHTAASESWCWERGGHATQPLWPPCGPAHGVTHQDCL